MKKRIVSLFLVLMLVLGFVFLSKTLSGSDEVNYGVKSGRVSFSNEHYDITEDVLNLSDYYKVAENDNFVLMLDNNANPVINSKTTGKMFYSVCQDQNVNSKYTSALSITYYSDNSTENTLFSTESSLDKKQVKVYQEESGVRVEYGFGDLSENYIYPDMISQERMEHFFKKMSDEEIDYIKRRYEYYDISLFENENKDYLLNEFPRLEKENLYVLVSASTKLVRDKTNEIFINAGYTVEDQAKDNAGAETNVKNPQAFRIGIVYSLTEDGFTATIDKENCAFYSDYPLKSINILPYFYGFSGQDEGYSVIPEGSGTLIDMSVSIDEYVGEYAVFGENLALVSKIEDESKQLTLPVFGQFKNDSGFLCIFENAAPQGKIRVDRNKVYASASPSFEIIDSGSFKMNLQNPVTLFATDVSDESYSVRYVLFDSLDEGNAYSKMATTYRDILLKNGQLNRKNNNGVNLLVEIINSISYDTVELGCIPTKKEFPMTSFSQVEDITNNILEYAESDSLSILLDGWNKNGLNRQKLGNSNFSSVAGGKEEISKLLNSLNSKNISAFLDFEFTSFEPFVMDNFNPAKMSVRTVNNEIVTLEKLDAVTNKYIPSKIQLVSPSNITNICTQYLNNNYLKNCGYGVSDLTRYLFGDYKSDTLFARSKSIKEITSVLKEIKEKQGKVMGNAGNVYSLEYLSLINNVPTNSSNLKAHKCDIPFVQMVLHGCIDYVSTEYNDANKENMLLKLIESGSGLHYIITANSFQDLFETNYSHLYNTNYNDLKDEIKNVYSKLNTALAGLGNCLISSHSYLNDDVAITTYDNGTSILVNYGVKDFTVGEYTVRAKDYLRIEKNLSN